MAWPEDSDLVRAGMGTLNVRDSILRHGEEVALPGDAEVIASAGMWTGLSLLNRLWTASLRMALPLSTATTDGEFNAARAARSRKL
ncbi:hypothetical protein AAGW05_11100 [Arthrobacter sp. LAPM80]|uniref:hypothetical protein n=1 Tax=Arthrobacter sp. LAPM80 TaxID=3141788 RepID=UPI00398A564B